MGKWVQGSGRVGERGDKIKRKYRKTLIIFSVSHNVDIYTLHTYIQCVRMTIPLFLLICVVWAVWSEWDERQFKLYKFSHMIFVAMIFCEMNWRHGLEFAGWKRQAWSVWVSVSGWTLVAIQKPLYYTFSFSLINNNNRNVVDDNVMRKHSIKLKWTRTQKNPIIFILVKSIFEYLRKFLFLTLSSSCALRLLCTIHGMTISWNIHTHSTCYMHISHVVVLSFLDPEIIMCAYTPGHCQLRTYDHQ